MKILNRKFWTRKKTLSALIVLAVVFFGYRSLFSNGKISNQTQIKYGPVSEVLILTGEVRAIEHTNLHFNMPGTLAWVGVNAGETVRRGQALMQLNTTRLNAIYQTARLRLSEAEAALNAVYDSLQGKELTATFAEISTRVSAESAKNAAYENMIAAQKDLNDATLRAPFEGIVSYMATEVPGANILAGATQITIVNPESIYFEVSADQTEITKIQDGQEVVVSLDSFPDRQINGKVTLISQTPSQGEFGSVYRVRVSFIDSEEEFDMRVGMTGDASFIVAQEDKALLIPISFLNQDNNGPYVNLNSPDNRVYVQIGVMGEEEVEIIGELSEGDIVYD